GAPIAELRRRLGCVAERAVEGGGELGRVGHDREVSEARRVEHSADRPHAAVHTDGRRDHVRPGPRMRERFGREQLEGRIVVDLAVLHDAAVAVVGVHAEADVDHEDEPRRRLADGPERARDDAARIGGAAAARVLPLRHAEEDDGRHAQVPEAPAFLGRAIDRALRDARHRPDRLLDPTAGNDEERLHELRRVDVRLPYQAAERLSPAQPPGAVGGKAAHDGARIKASERGLWKRPRRPSWPRLSDAALVREVLHRAPSGWRSATWGSSAVRSPATSLYAGEDLAIESHARYAAASLPKCRARAAASAAA